MLIIIVRTAWKYDKKIISDLEIKKENGSEKKLLKNLKYSKRYGRKKNMQKFL